MPEPNRFQVLDGHDVTELPGLHDRLDRAGVRRVAHHVADSEHDPGLLYHRHDPPGRRLVRRHRFFQQDVITQPGEHLGRLGVHPVLRADQDRVGEPVPAGQLPPVRGRVLDSNAVLGGEPGPAQLAGLGHRHYGRAIRMVAGPPGIPGTAHTCPEDDYRNRCHSSDLPLNRGCSPPATGSAALATPAPGRGPVRAAI